MSRRNLISVVLILATLILVVDLFLGSMDSSSKEGFTLTFLENNVLLISDSDVVSYNVTSQEIAITEIASERLLDLGDKLYSFTGFAIRIDGEELYHVCLGQLLCQQLLVLREFVFFFPPYSFNQELRTTMQSGCFILDLSLQVTNQKQTQN